MIVETLPRLDIPRLTRSGQRRGSVQLKGGLRVRFQLDLNEATHRGTAHLRADGCAMTNQYRLRFTARQGRWQAACPECGARREILYWNPARVDTRPDLPAVCRRCVGATHLSEHYSRAAVPGLRADLRQGLYQPALDAISSGNGRRYTDARIAMEREGIVPDRCRLFTHPDGRAARFAYTQE